MKLVCSPPLEAGRLEKVRAAAGPMAVVNEDAAAHMADADAFFGKMTPELLAGAKKLQRASMSEIRRRFGARTARLCYPAMATTALGAIPGGLTWHFARPAV